MYIIGDFNLDILKIHDSDYVNDFVTQTYASSFFPLITKPTRITDKTATLIDNIFVNNTSKLKWNQHLPSPVEDWSAYYSIPFLYTSSGKLRSFQHRMFHRTINENVLLMKMGIKDHDDCFFCDSNPET